MQVLNVRLTQAQHDQIQRRAQAAGLSMSELVRRLVLDPPGRARPRAAAAGRVARGSVDGFERIRRYRRRDGAPARRDRTQRPPGSLAVLNLRLSTDELIGFRARAAAEGTNMSELVRRLALDGPDWPGRTRAAGDVAAHR